MEFIKTKLPGLVVLKPSFFEDKRGYFVESFNKNKFEEGIGIINFIQDNESKSSRGVVRGLHFQKPPYAQAKLVRCVKGEILDVAVDIRKKSPTYGKSFSIILSGENKKQLFVPRGFAHGFSVLSSSAIVAYKVDNDYAPEYESGIIYSDKSLNIDWGLDEKEILISEKDLKLKEINEVEIPFNYSF